MQTKLWKAYTLTALAASAATGLFAGAVRCDAQAIQPVLSVRLEQPALPGVSSSSAEATTQFVREFDTVNARMSLAQAAMLARTNFSSSTSMALDPMQAGQATAVPIPPAATVIGAETTTKSAPFSEDWTWLNGNPRTVDTPLATKYFTPEFRADINYTFDANHPKDDSLGGSTETFRSAEVQVEQLSFGGDLRIDNVRGRFLTMYGMFSTTTPRNDATPSRGQWDLSDAYRYVSEAWGGYHWDKMHGINLDAGIFVSYIGLFSYYNFDNWAYQPSYVSSNTPWFFNGVRGQFFVTKKLKIEPWFINGWQSYGRANSKPGLGGQILYRPTPWLAIVTNNYGYGEDAVGIPYRHRLHTDNSVEVKYYDNKTNYIDKGAFSFTADAGCEFGLGGAANPGSNVSCHGDTKPAGYGGAIAPKQYFIGWMAYNRLWWAKDKYALTVGGGQMSNPGRYLTLLPPINGATASTGTPYFTENPGDKMTAWDGTITYDYMPSQFITFRTETGYRHSSVPYWTGRGGITPPGGNNGSPGSFACASGASSGATDIPTAQLNCGGAAGATDAVWFPDLRRDQLVVTVALMVKF